MAIPTIVFGDWQQQLKQQFHQFHTATAIYPDELAGRRAFFDYLIFVLNCLADGFNLYLNHGELMN